MGAASQPLVGEFGEPAFHQVHPRAVGGCEVQAEPGVSKQPAVDLRGLVGGGVVDDHMDVELVGNGAVDEVQEPSELDGPVAIGHVGDDLARGDVEGHVEIGGAVAFVVVGASLGESRAQREDGSGAIQGLDLGLLVHTEHQSAIGGIEVKAHHITHLFDELGVGAELEGVDQVGLESEGPPNATHARLAHPRRLGHRPSRPVGGVEGCLLQRRHDQRFDMVVGDRTRDPGARFVVQSLQSFGNEPPPPLRHRRFAHPNATGHLAVGVTAGALEHDATPKRQGLRALRPPSPPLQRVPLVVVEDQLGLWPSPLSHGRLPSSPMRERTRRGGRRFLYLKESQTRDTSRSARAAHGGAAGARSCRSSSAVPVPGSPCPRADAAARRPPHPRRRTSSPPAPRTPPRRAVAERRGGRWSAAPAGRESVRLRWPRPEL